ncbi:MAG: hypothetical protein JJV93_01490 [Alphaproteobacteria bacterium]|nr:hypothetical protein [Alphaproteobacteria bacterium]
MNNPFKKDTTSYIDFKVMTDLKWHCTKCELKSGQAKTWQVWRQEKGIQLDKDKKGNLYNNIFCSNCDKKTIHRKLKSLKIIEQTKARFNISTKTSKKIKKLYKNEECIFLRTLSDRELEIDHKFPQIRWGKNEENFNNYTDDQLKEKFMLLNRSNNLLKSRNCEKCFKTEDRGNFPGIEYWYKGNKQWEGKDKNDINGCEGCFWYDPYKWRKELKKIIGKKVNNTFV